jgi:hypothetical protein
MIFSMEKETNTNWEQDFFVKHRIGSAVKRVIGCHM